ncbi:chromosome partition protein Smc-like isoform X2 [Papilio machaon]|uniref:chromosome partition protein Smc-like isoform X1 n=1 Tax=Papilio machaon TaxID=76193 RepID=UPI001E66570F|nr:chromosome partition protein Smc-like isoform X1 [Papilio machaon]XP_045541254.1 chromosome partition protein Smc-like isoform X2 [Papilio machaon]
MQTIEEHTKLINENNKKIEKLNENLIKYHNTEHNNNRTYAAVVAPNTARKTREPALHSIKITSKNTQETGEEILNKIRETVKAKEGDIKIEKIRKAKDRKIIIGCNTIEERRKLKEKLGNEKELIVEEMKNKDPLVILKGVLTKNTDDDIIEGLRTQNKNIFKELEKEQDRIEIAFKKRARNPLTNHIILRVSPKLWNLMIEAGAVHIDLQKIKVADQSPLVQCSKCLGYGHGKRFCKEESEKCSHCGGWGARVGNLHVGPPLGLLWDKSWGNGSGWSGAPWTAADGVLFLYGGREVICR